MLAAVAGIFILPGSASGSSSPLRYVSIYLSIYLKRLNFIRNSNLKFILRICFFLFEFFIAGTDESVAKSGGLYIIWKGKVREYCEYCRLVCTLSLRLNLMPIACRLKLGEKDAF